MINQPSLSVLRLPEWFYFIILGIALSLLGELPWGGWLQIPSLSIVWWRLAALGSSSSRRSLEGGFAFGLGYFVIGLWWIYISLHDVGGMHAVLSAAAVLLLSAYMAIFFALASALAFRLRSTSIFLNSSIAAAAWVMMEYLRGQLFTGFPWLGFAESQVNGPFWPIAPLLGGLGSSFLAIWASMQIAQWQRSIWRAFIPVVIALILMLGFGQLRFTEAIGKPMTVRLIQGNFEQSLKWNPSAIERQIDFYSEAILNQAADLIVIPETAFPWPQRDLPKQTMPSLKEFSKTSNSNVLIGLIGVAPEANGVLRYSNRAVGISPAGEDLYYYDKTHLVPFGEFIPPGFQWFVNAFKVPMSDFARGSLSQAPFLITRPEQDKLGAAITICYEDIFGNELAGRIRKSSEPVNVLINMTNLAWFGESQAPSQQLRLSQMRSIETGLPSIRATNTGITAVIGADGRVLQSLPQFTQDTLSTSVQAFAGKTPFVVWGNWPILGLSSLILLLALIRLRRF